MKLLIWFLCILAASLIRTFFELYGVTFGAIPVVILYGLTIFIAKKLCEKWDKKHGE